MQVFPAKAKNAQRETFDSFVLVLEGARVFDLIVRLFQMEDVIDM
jgi:hypothetical protein